jgi:uncharacterized damage-inducible protein DinB
LGKAKFQRQNPSNVHVAVLQEGQTVGAFLGNSRDNNPMTDFRALYIDEVFRSLRGHKRLADGAIAQLSDEQFFATPDSESNSVAIIVKHLAGNMRSRFTDFLTSDGEKPDRNRDREFVMHNNAQREEVLASWEQNWELVFRTLNSLHPEDLERTVTIRGEPHSVLQAINRQVVHYAYHVGQIVFLAKHWKTTEWKTLSVPRGQSEQVNARMAEKHKQG